MRLFLSSLVAAGLLACGGENPTKPLDPALVVKAEDGVELRGAAKLTTDKDRLLLVELDLKAAVPPAKKGDPPAETSWAFAAKVSRDEVLSGEVTLKYAPGTSVTYTSEHGGGGRGTAKLQFGNGRITGTMTAEAGGAVATIDGGLTIECMVDRDDLADPPDVPFGTRVNDAKLETTYCRTLKALK